MAITPAQWTDQRDVMVEFNLGYGEQETQIQKYLAFHQLFSSDPSLGQMYGPQQKHQMLGKILDMSGIKNVADYLMDPKMIPPPPPNPAQQMQMQMQQKQLEISDRQTTVAEQKAAYEAEIGRMKLELESSKPSKITPSSRTRWISLRANNSIKKW